MGTAERANHKRIDEGGAPKTGLREVAAGPTWSDQHAKSAKQMVDMMLNSEKALTKALSLSKVSPTPVDLTTMIVETLAAQSRTLAFILDEILLAREGQHAITFRPPQANDGRMAPGPGGRKGDIVL